MNIPTTQDLNQDGRVLPPPGPHYRHALQLSKDVLDMFGVTLPNLQIAHYLLKGAQLRDAERESFPCSPSESSAD